MSFQQILDSLPIGGVFVAFAIFALTIIEVGYRYGYWWQERTQDEKEGPTGMIVGSLLALMAFLLAVAMGMASDRFDTRRGLVLAEANSIDTTYLRAGYLPEPASSEIRDLLREYIPLRIATDNLADVRVKIARSVELQEKLWSVAEGWPAPHPNLMSWPTNRPSRRPPRSSITGVSPLASSSGLGLVFKTIVDPKVGAGQLRNWPNIDYLYCHGSNNVTVCL